MPKFSLCILPYTSKMDDKGKIILSSHSQLITQSAIYLFEEGGIDKIYIPGESTFGTGFSSTSKLILNQLVKEAVPVGKITSSENLNDTEVQLIWTKNQNPQNLLVLCFKFHSQRTRYLLDQIGLEAKIIIAEEILLKYDPKVLSAKLDEVIGSKFKVMGIPRVYFLEKIDKIATSFGFLGKLFLKLIRQLIGKDGPTVTDYEFVDSAKLYLRQAQNKGLKPH